MSYGPPPPQGPYAAQPTPEDWPGPGYRDAPPPPPPGPYPYAYPYPPRQGTNTLAILALVFAFVFAPAAIVLGVCGRRQIRRTGEEGMGLATAGMIIGIVFTVLMAIWIVFAILMFAVFVHQVNNNQPQNAMVLLASLHAYTGI